VRTGFSLYFKCTSTSLFTDVILKFEHFFVWNLIQHSIKIWRYQLPL
jgi:hypothetical protein